MSLATPLYYGCGGCKILDFGRKKHNKSKNGWLRLWVSG